MQYEAYNDAGGDMSDNDDYFMDAQEQVPSFVDDAIPFNNAPVMPQTQGEFHQDALYSNPMNAVNAAAPFLGSSQDPEINEQWATEMRDFGMLPETHTQESQVVQPQPTYDGDSLDDDLGFGEEAFRSYDEFQDSNREVQSRMMRPVELEPQDTPGLDKEATHALMVVPTSQSEVQDPEDLENNKVEIKATDSSETTAEPHGINGKVVLGDSESEPRDEISEANIEDLSTEKQQSPGKTDTRSSVNGDANMDTYTTSIEIVDIDSEAVKATATDEVELTRQNEMAVAEHLNSIGYTYFPVDTPSRPDTPPLPGNTYYNPNTVNKTAASHGLLPSGPAQFDLSLPTVPRDLPQDLRHYWRFYDRCLHLIPRLPNYNSLDWTRRYWIAVLLMDKNPANVKHEKDFLWMKGNRFTTVATIWHNYQTRTMCDPEDFKLVVRGQVVDMKDRVEELDWFGRRFVVFRAVSEAAAKKIEANGGLLNNMGIVPDRKVDMTEVVVID